MINTELLVDFLNLARNGNFSTTARARGISQSTLSRRIAQLEDFVGAPLLDRTVQPATLTAAGEALLPLAQDILEQMQRIHAIGHPEPLDSDDGCSMIAASALAVHFFPGWISRHSVTEHWRVNLLNTDPLFATNLRHFLHGKADFLLTFGKDTVPDLYALRHHRYVVLGTDLACPVSTPEPDGSPKWSLDGDGPVNCCNYTKGSFFQQALAEQTSRLAHRLHKVRDNSVAAVLHSMVRQGQCLSWLPRLTIEDELRSGALVLAGGPEHFVETEIRLYCAHNLGRYAHHFWTCVSTGHRICRKSVHAA